MDTHPLITTTRVDIRSTGFKSISIPVACQIRRLSWKLRSSTLMPDDEKKISWTLTFLLNPRLLDRSMFQPY